MLTVNSLSGFGSRAAFATTVIPGASDWTDVGSGLTFGTGTFDASAEACARTVDSFAGDFELTATVQGETNWNFGCYLASGTINSATGNGIKGINPSYSYNGGDDTLFYRAVGQSVTETWASSGTRDTVTIKRVGTTITFMKNTSNIIVFSQLTSDTLRIMFGAGGTTDINDIQWVV